MTLIKFLYRHVILYEIWFCWCYYLFRTKWTSLHVLNSHLPYICYWLLFHLHRCRVAYKVKLRTRLVQVNFDWMDMSGGWVKECMLKGSLATAIAFWTLTHSPLLIQLVIIIIIECYMISNYDESLHTVIVSVVSYDICFSSNHMFSAIIIMCQK